MFWHADPSSSKLLRLPLAQVQTKGTRDKKGKPPQQAYKDALSALESEFQDMYKQFELSTQDQGNGAPLQQPP